MNVLDKHFGEVANLYNELIKKVLLINKVKKITFIDGDFSKKYDYATISKNGDIKVFLKGFMYNGFNGFLFDFTFDYASLLRQIEHDLYFVNRGGNPVYMEFEFNK